jgi:cardiolipin synthase C
MHNKLLVVDNSVALIGGRNIGDQYFQIDPESQFADDDVFAAGPIAQDLSNTFRRVLEQRPVDTSAGARRRYVTSRPALKEHRDELKEQKQQLKADGVDYVKLVATGEPFNGMVSGRLPLIWAHAQVVCDSPDKKNVENGAMVGRLMQRAVFSAANAVQSELLMITPYLIPGNEGMQMFNDLHRTQTRASACSPARSRRQRCCRRPPVICITGYR